MGKISKEKYDNIMASYPERDFDKDFDAAKTAQNMLNGIDIAAMPSAIRPSGNQKKMRTKAFPKRKSDKMRKAILELMYCRDRFLFGDKTLGECDANVQEAYALSSNVSLSLVKNGGEYPCRGLQHEESADGNKITNLVVSGRYAVVSHPSVVDYARKSGVIRVPYYDGFGEMMTISPEFLERCPEAAKLEKKLRRVMKCVYDERRDENVLYYLEEQSRPRNGVIMHPAYCREYPVPLEACKDWILLTVKKRTGAYVRHEKTHVMMLSAMRGKNVKKAMDALLDVCTDAAPWGTHYMQRTSFEVPDDKVVPQWTIDVASRMIALTKVWLRALRAEDMSFDAFTADMLTPEWFARLHHELGIDAYLEAIANGVDIDDVCA